jgi:hypothetical protein
MTPQLNEIWYRYEYAIYGDPEDYRRRSKILIEARKYRSSENHEQGIWVKGFNSEVHGSS